MPLIYDLTVVPLKEFFEALNAAERSILQMMLALAAAVGFYLGRWTMRGPRRSGAFGSWRFPSFQNAGEALVSRVLHSHFRTPDYHLLNHVTLRMEDGTTQVDHILVSRFGVFVVETKDYGGWIFADAQAKTWTNVRFHRKYKFQNPIHQNYRHVLAVQRALDFIPREAIKSVVVFCGSAEFKTDVPEGVLHVNQLDGYIRSHAKQLIELKRMQYAVGCLETERLALSGQTDLEHLESLKRRFRREAV